MPSRTACTPWTRPRRLSGLAAFPKGEIHRMSLAFVDIYARTGLKIFHLSLREASVRRILVDLEVHISIDGVCEPIIDQCFRHRDDVGHVFCSLRLFGWLSYPKLAHVFIIGFDIFVRNRVTGNALFVRTLNDLVVHIGEVLDEIDLVTVVFQIPAEHVEDECAASMADVAIIVDGHAADIHPDMLRLNRLERFLSAAERIEECQHSVLRSGRGRSSWPMRPEKITRSDSETKTDDDVELVKIIAQMFPLFSHLDPDIRQEIAPGQSAKEGEKDKAGEIHAGDTRRQRNKRAHDRQHAAEEHRGFSIPRKPTIRRIEVLVRD